VLSAATSLRIGYAFSNGCTLCWRCHRQNCSADRMENALAEQSNASDYPKLAYLSGFMLTLWSDNEEARSRHCDECGIRLVADG